MSEQKNPDQTPACPMCAGKTRLKEVHRELMRQLEVFKCLACEVEYPVLSPLPGIGQS